MGHMSCGVAYIKCICEYGWEASEGFSESMSLVLYHFSEVPCWKWISCLKHIPQSDSELAVTRL